MKRRLLMFFAILAIAASAMARPVDPSIASQVASNYLRAVTGKAYDNLTDITAQTPFHEFYVFTLGQERGFILIAADDCVIPVLGYSETSTFPIEGMPAHVRDWMDTYEEEIAFYREHYGELVYGGSPEVRSQWNNLEKGVAPLPPLPTAVSPLVTTQWNQSPYYNNLCPYDNDYSERTVTGCVATATAQVMKFWNHPTTGYGSNSYTHSTYGTLSADFGATTYNWSNMPTSLSGSSTTAQVNAVATLMYHIGVAINMGYGPSATGGSGAVTGSNNLNTPAANNALVSYFKYKPTLHFEAKEDYTEAQWSAMLQGDLNSGHPILYKGRDPTGGHAFVCDGYNNQGQFHFNWGWGGSYNGYYTMGDLHPGTGGTGGNSTYTFNLSNGAVLGIEPITNWSTSATTTITASTTNTSYGSVTGGGTYNFGDTITIRASANTGCRFYQWSDGSVRNPRQMLSTGGNLSVTANIGPLSGDTLGYCFNGMQNSLGNGSGNCYWGIMIPGSVVTSGHVLTAVEYYLNESGTYDLTIYTGTTSPTTAVHTQSFTLTDEGAWNTMTLSTPVTIPSDQNFWITLHDNGVAYPCTYSSSSGNPDGVLWGSSFSSIMNSGWDVAFMIRGIFTDSGVTPGPGPTPDPSGCNVVLTIGDTTSTATALQYPVNNWYKYTLSETIIDASELQGMGRITGISYHYNHTTASTKKTDVTIWIQPTTKTAFTSNSDLEILNANTAVMVYSGALNCSQGWNEFQFTTPFFYDGTSNLMIIVDDNSNDYDGNAYTFNTAACSDYKTLAWYSDSYNPDPTNNSFSGTKYYYQARVQMRLKGCEPVPESGDVTVADGTDNNEYVPFYGYWADEDQHNQMIYPATDLSAMVGRQITQMVFYIDPTANNGSNTSSIGTWTVSLGETTATTLSGIDNTTSRSTVYDGYMNFDLTENTMTVNFTTPYVYNGGNLLVDFDHEAASWNRWYFLGINSTGSSYTYNNQRDFLPKVTFSYEPVPSCAAPEITINSNEGRNVSFSWTCPGDSVYITLINNDGQQIWGHFYGPNDTTVSFANLPEQYFPFGYGYVYAVTICGDIADSNISDWAWDVFTVTCDAVNQCPVTFVLTDSYGDGWNGGALDIYDTVSGLIVGSMSAANHGGGNVASTDTVVYNFCPDRVYSVVYRSGSYDDEVSFQILGSNGDTLFNVSEPTAGTLGFFTHTCGNCVAMNPVIGDTTSTSTSYYTPVNNYYKYTLSETIIDAAEIGGPMTINSISYYYNYATASTKKTNCTIYLQPTTKSVFASNSDIELLDVTSAVMVYTGELNCQQGWNTFTFTTPYYYDGEDNLMVIVDDNSNDYDGNSYTFRTSTCNGYKSLYWYSDSQNPDPTSSTFTGSKGWAQARVVMSLDGCQATGVSCPKPTNIAETHATNNATVTWSSSASNHSVTLMDASGNTLNYATTNTTTMSFTSLTPNTEYIVAVRALCSATDSSTATNISFRTNCTTLTAADLPYTEDFESYASGSSATISPCWTKGTNSTTAYPYPSTTTITGARSLYFYGNKPSSATGTSIYSYAALPEVDASVDVSSLTVSFNARRYSNTGANYRSLLYVGVMTDPTDISTFLGLGEVNMTPLAASTIENYRVDLTNYAGTGKYIAFCCPAVDTTTSYTYNYIYIDDVVLDFTPNCQPVSGLTSSDITNNSVTLTWTDANNTGATYTVSDVTGSVIASGITTNTYTVTGLTGLTDYTFSVVANCSATDASPVATIAVHTMPDPIMCGNDPALVFANAENITGTTNYFPGYSYYNYSYSEVIIPATQLLGLGEIKGMEFYVNTLNSGSTYFNNCEIYLMNTSTASLADGFIQDSAGFQLVYTGSLNQDYTGWNLVTFNNTFQYDGSSNLVVAIRRNHGSYATSGTYGSYTASESLGRYVYNDGSAYTIGNITGGTAVTNVPVYHMVGCAGVAPDCMPVRNLTVSAVTTNSVTLTWADTINSGATYTVMTDSVVVASGITTTTYTVTGLASETSYTFTVVANCSATTSSLPISVSAFTGYCQPNPTTVDGSGITSVAFGGMTNTTSHAGSTAAYVNNSSMAGSVPAGTTASIDITYATGYTYGTIIWVDWNNNMGFEGNEVVYAGESTNTNPTTLTATFDIPATQALGNYRMRILGSDMTFDSYTSSIAAAADADPCATFSWGVAEDYTLTVTSAPSCLAVTDVTVTDITATSATLSWTDALNSGATYSVLDATGATVATGLSATTYTLTGLTAATSYTFGVVANCSANEASSATTVSFTTTAATEPCLDVTALGVDSITQTSVTVSWTGNAANYSLYRDGTYVTNVTTNNYTFTGLTAATSYTFGVTAICSASDSANMVTVAASTQAVSNQITVTLTQNNPMYGSVTGDGVYTIGDNVTVSATPAMGYHFVNWVDVTGAPVSTANPYTFVAATDITLQAVFAQDTIAVVTLAVNDATMGTITPAPGTYQHVVGETISIDATPATGYHFLGWQESYTFFDTTYSYTDTTTITHFEYVVQDIDVVLTNWIITAVFTADSSVVPEPDTLVVTFAVNDATMGTTIPAPGTYNYYNGDTVFFGSQAYAGYRFLRWEVTWGDNTVDTLDDVYANGFYLPADYLMDEGPVTFEAIFGADNPDSMMVTVAVNDPTMGTTIPAPGVHYYYAGQVPSLVAQPYPGNHLEGWAFTVNVPGSGIQSDTMYAIEDFFETILHGNPLPTSYCQLEWNVTALFAPGAAPVTHDDTLIVTTSVNNAEWGTITPAPGTHYYGEGDVVTFGVQPNDGYYLYGLQATIAYPRYGIHIDTIFTSLDEFLNDMDSVIVVDSTMLGLEITLHAIFMANGQTPDEYTVTVNYDATMGNVLVGGEPVADGTSVTAIEGSSVTFTANAYNNFEFVAWVDNGDTVGRQTVYTINNIDATHSVTAVFQPTTGIANVDMENVTIYSTDNVIVVRGAEGKPVVLFDVNGRMLSREASAAERVEFRVTNSGVYLVKVANAAAKRVVVIR